MPLLTGAFLLILWLAVCTARAQYRTQALCTLKAELPGAEITEELLRQMEKLPGFESRSICYGADAGIRVGMYTAQARILGVDLNAGLLTPVLSAGKKAAGSRPLLIVGEDFLSGLTDEHGYAITERQRDILKEQLGELEARLTLDGAPEGKTAEDTAQFLGIVKESGVYMDAGLMKAWLQKWNLPCRISCVKITVRGSANAESAQECLREAGFEVEREP